MAVLLLPSAIPLKEALFRPETGFLFFRHGKVFFEQYFSFNTITMKALFRKFILALVLVGFSGQGYSQQKHAKRRKELRYLFFANGGFNAYFDDGTVVGCPRCDFMRSNIWQMWKRKPEARYKVLPDGSLLINGQYREHPVYEPGAADGWALIDYKWYTRPLQE